MKIIIHRGYNPESCLTEEMEIDGVNKLSVYPLYESPEDATIERDLVGCSDVANYMNMAYLAGKNGEEFSIEIVEEP